MAKEGWGNLGDEIKDMVESAIVSQDFKTLSKSLEKTVNSAMNTVEESLRKDANVHRQPERMPGDRTSRQIQRRNTPRVVRNSPIYAPTWGMQGAGLALSISCGIVTGGLGLAVFILILVSLLGGGMAFGQAIGVGVMVPLLLVSGFLTGVGKRILGRLKRFRMYTRQLGSRTYCTVKELAGCIGKSESYVRKDLRRMIQKRMFRQGHLDRTGSCLMVTDEAWRQYLEAEHQYALREAEQRRIAENARRQEETEKQNANDVPSGVQKVIQEGQTYLRKIKECNTALRDTEVSGKIARMELVVEKILERVQGHPELVPDLSKFMEYYLPTTVKLLDAYQELDAQPVQGVNIQNSKKEIADSLDTINHAFEKLLDSFFQDAAWDISSDISVLQMMLAQEGLTEDGISGASAE